MNTQEIFDTIVNHLRKQGRKALANPNLASNKVTNACCYRSPNGDKCAAGCLIPDDLYHRNMEGMAIDSLIETVKFPPYFKANEHLISEMQWIHDKQSIVDWEENWKRIATDYQLVYTPPESP